MNISPINFYNTSFKSTSRTIYRDNKKGDYASNKYDPYYCSMTGIDTPKIVNSNKTHFLRTDLPWHILPKFLQEKYPQDKVNVYNFACSDGSEPYSLAFSLINALGKEEAQRFFPIIASDIDPEIIKQAQKGQIKITRGEYERLLFLIKKPNEIKDFFEVKKENNNGSLTYILKPTKLLSENIVFKCQDISEGLENVEKSNSIVLARNFWRYLSCDELEKTSITLRKNLDSSSLIFIGDFDKVGSKKPFFMENLGIKPVERNEMFANILKITPYHDCVFLHEPNLWHNKVQNEYLDYKLPYGVY